MAKNVTRVEVIGHVQQSGGMANDMSLSQARARQATGFLTTPKRRVNTFVEGVGRRRSALPECIAVKNRCAVVSISYVPQAS
jgi:outer membrane protein OmpA-like peptidoglycan-associated protein